MRKTYYAPLMMALCVLLSGLLGWVTPAYATTQSASLTVEYIYDDEPLEDVEVEIFLIAAWSNGAYVLTPQFEDLAVDFSDLSSPSDWRDEGELVDDYIHDETCTCVDCQHTDSTGSTAFSDLEYGVYYVDVADVDYEDGTLTSSPVLITLPTYDNTTNDYTYDIVMEPKVAFVSDPEEPDKPTPSNPQDPDDPEDPEEPEEPDEPETPEEPEEPDEPDDPGTPVTPEVPETPRVPADSEFLIALPDTDIPKIRAEEEYKIPQTGTSAWLILPLALMGGALTALGLVGLGKKGKKP